ncbi:MAG: chromate transporter, partial [Pseudomonadota bacterium]|nr:chromate transporter [Pseudomonadota bacterium]
APMYLLAVAGFVAIFLFAVPFPIIIAGAALIGLIGGMTRPDLFVVIKGQSADGAVAESVVDAMAARGELSHTKPSAARSVLLIAVFGVLWGGPVAVLFIILGGENVFAQEAGFFSKLAVVTFGGAYAVLAYMAQQAVETYGWLTGTEMLDGLGLAETTPGPLIMVTQFVGFLGAYRHAVGIDPILAGVIGSVVTVWVTFAPCFLWIFFGAPYIERLRDNLHLSAALSGITAAVVGVIMNLAVWFGLRVAFAEVGSMEVAGISLPTMAAESANLTAIGMTIVAGIVMFRLHWDVLRTLALCGVGAILIHLMI